MIDVLLLTAALAAGAPPGAGAPTDGNCGMMGGGPMHGPRRGMMGGCVPSGVAPEALPESDSRGAKMFVRYCAQCHHLPSPATHSAEEWPAAAERMINRMEQYRISRRGMGRIVVQLPTTEERQAIVAYLQRHALAPATTDALGSSDSPGLSQFKQTCSQCHALPDPRLHTATEWPGVVVRMRSNMKIMGKPEITDQERDAIVGYLESR